MTVASILFLTTLVNAGPIALETADQAAISAAPAHDEESSPSGLIVVVGHANDSDADGTAAPSPESGSPSEASPEDTSRPHAADASKTGDGAPNRTSSFRFGALAGAAGAAAAARPVPDFSRGSGYRGIQTPPKASSKKGFWSKSSGRKSLRFGRRGIGIPIPGWLMVVLAPVGLAVMIVQLIAKCRPRPPKTPQVVRTWPAAPPRRRSSPPPPPPASPADA